MMISKLNIYTVIAVLLLTITGSAQNNFTRPGKLFVHNQANGQGIALHQNKIFSRDQGILTTERDKGEESRVLFSNASSWEGATNYSYVDGFVESNHNEPFVFPVGSAGHYKAMACSKPTGVAAAYFSDDSSFDIEESASNGTKLLDKSAFWVVQGAIPTEIIFSWNESDGVSKFTGDDITKLKILGFDGSSWKTIESKLEPFSFDTRKSKLTYTETPTDLNVGAISTNEIIPNLFMAYAIGISNNPSEPYTTAFASTNAAVSNDNVASANGNVSTTRNVSNTNERVASAAPEGRVTPAEVKAIKENTSGNLNLSNYSKLKSIHFPFTESQITRYSTNLLQRMASKLKETNPRIVLIGHADFYGPDDFNYQLGLDRANEVKQMLAGFGLNSVEVDIMSNGEKDSDRDCETKNCTKKETLIDRRVDIYIYN